MISSRKETSDYLAQDFQGAISFYDQALETCPDGPNTHIFLSNRAAAYTHLKDYERAAADCSEAIALKTRLFEGPFPLGSSQFPNGKDGRRQRSALSDLWSSMLPMVLRLPSWIRSSQKRVPTAEHLLRRTPWQGCQGESQVCHLEEVVECLTWQA